ncbi:glutathione S-transferase family protein [Candidatus Uabimicrobium sp. HlEnr_7]|uniref:glutathione S-transferase family protein n=1 Tax=Candidatus Uabimicrobium helgolandensis TaxID=3095367 RepID=UPI003558F016
MGLLVEGTWHDKWYDTEKSKGRFIREQSSFRNQITRDGSSGFSAEPGRYHLYVSYACPWAHRTLIFRVLKNLEEAISVSVVDIYMGSDGWSFSEEDGAIPDFVNNKKFLHEIYTKEKSDYTGRVTVPVLWDKQKQTIVNNESSEIILMFNSEFSCTDDSIDYYPQEQREEIDEVNDFVYKNINNGVYKAGFSTSQEAYEEAFTNLFNALDKIENTLKQQRYLIGDQITIADWRLFVTLIRFDVVYVGHFKCNLRRLEDYPNISNYVRELYQIPGIAETVNFTHIKRHYYESHKAINPTGVVPKGPEVDFTTPHNRS